ncbi:uncharacterized protein LY89DRAFT_784788 [Mollisia scopiformis]|uniref:Zn(2)-C6 fungal-type domain-containing protein n=1 Tax=Mollisia scopiformis TaxID=149040 RepID=A0A194X1U7_MOLSC|nr:uncharacterized protein LY89DRAFT_784788 [Mollisia scopiformis]KUJ13954.1 hypothetical protein LY89DRAFT_784788 [Mollisia scopiformis]
MVNIAGRSKGCSTCRKKRVKCDENRPICTRCLNRGLECDGAKEISFVEAKIVRSRRSDKSVAMSSDAVVDATGAPSSPLKGNELEIYICYTMENCLRGGIVNTTLKAAPMNEIITAATTPNGKIFHHAVLSLAVLFFGTEHRQSKITVKGYAMHGVALKRLNQALAVPGCYAHDEVILAVVTLALLECFIPTGPNHFLKHMSGLERLLELRGPGTEGYSSSSSKLGRGARHMILFASLRTGKPSILARPEWKAALRIDCPVEQLPEQDLIDILADCTVLVAGSEKILANGGLELEGNARQRDEIEVKALSLLEQLRAWKRGWDTDLKNAYFETLIAPERVQPTANWTDNSPPFLTIFEFSNDVSATNFMLYHAVTIYILRVLKSITIQTSSPMQNYSQDPTLQKQTKDEYIAAERLAALDVCRAVPYYIGLKAGLDLCHSPVVHMGVITAWITLGGVESAEGKWMMELLNAESREVIAKGLWVG